MVEVHEITIAEAQHGFNTGRFTARDLTAAFLERIEKLDKSGPQINSTMAISATALDDAEALDTCLKERGEFKGKLHGIPVLVKDQVSRGEAGHMTGLPYSRAGAHACGFSAG